MAKIVVTDTHADGVFSVIRRAPSSNQPDINVYDPEFAASIAHAVNNYDQLLAAVEFTVRWCEVNQREKTKLYDVAKAAIAAATK